MAQQVSGLPAASGWQAEQTFFSTSCEAHALPLERMTDTHREVLHYWQDKRGTDRAPPRAGLDPCDLPRALSHMALWEVGDDYRCRLSGTAVDAGLGCHLKGVALADMRCSRLDEAQGEFAAVRDRGLVSFAERTLGWVGKPYRYYRHLILPLRNAADEIGQLLSVLTFHNVSERAPHRLAH